MDELRPHLPLDPDETSWSFACRLAAFHTGSSVRTFLHILGISLQNFHAGEMQALTRLGTASGVAVEALIRSTVRVIAQQTHRFRDETWQQTFVVRAERRVCPACLVADEAEMPTLPPMATWKQRIAWSLEPMTSCPDHGLRLVDLSMSEASAAPLDLASLVPRAGGLERLVAEARPHDPSPLQDWIHDRLAGRPDRGGPWLSGQTIEQGARACEFLGAVHRHGARHVERRLTPEALQMAGDHGFQIALGGEAAVRTALDDIRAMSAGVAVQAGPRAVYGPLFSWLHDRSSRIPPGPIREAVREHILDHEAYDPGDTLLHEPVAERRLHSVRSLSDATYLSRNEVRRRLVRVGLMDPETTALAAARLAFPAAVAERFCIDIETAVSIVAAANLLGCTKAQAESLHDAGVLTSMSDRKADGSGGRTVFAPNRVSDLLVQVKDLTTSVESTLGTVDLDSAADRLATSFGAVVAMVLARQIGGVQWLRLRPGLSAVRIPLSSIASLPVRLPTD